MRKLPRLPKGITTPGIYFRPPMPTSRAVDWSHSRNRSKEPTQARLGHELADGSIVWLRVGDGETLAKLQAQALRGV
jgi:hypothetical protein